MSNAKLSEHRSTESTAVVWTIFSTEATGSARDWDERLTAQPEKTSTANKMTIVNLTQAMDSTPFAAI